MSIIFSWNITLFKNNHVTGSYWSTIGRHLLSRTVFFFSSCSWNEAKLGVSNTSWPLNSSDNNGRTLIGTAVLFLILFYSNFATLITGRLIEVWPLEVRLYLFSRRLQSVGEGGGGGLLIEMSLETNKYRNTKLKWCKHDEHVRLDRISNELRLRSELILGQMSFST